MSDILLDLDTLVDRKAIRIRSKLHPDAKLYDLRLPDELGVVEHQQLQARHRNVTKLDGVPIEKLTGKQAQQLTKALNDLLAIALIDLEDEVRDDLDEWKKARIVQAFVDQFPEPEAGEGGDPSTGGS